MLRREALIDRIRQTRRANPAAGQPAAGQPAAGQPAAERSVEHEHNQLHALETRIEHLEKLVQGLQDSVHRESLRHARRIGELEARMQPAALGKALRDDARDRGL